MFVRSVFCCVGFFLFIARRSLVLASGLLASAYFGSVRFAVFHRELVWFLFGFLRSRMFLDNPLVVVVLYTNSPSFTLVTLSHSLSLRSSFFCVSGGGVVAMVSSFVSFLTGLLSSLFFFFFVSLIFPSLITVLLVASIDFQRS